MTKLAEVEDNDVDLESGRLTVWGADVNDSRIKSAVESAGYSVAAATSAAPSSDQEVSDG